MMMPDIPPRMPDIVCARIVVRSVLIPEYRAACLFDPRKYTSCPKTVCFMMNATTISTPMKMNRT